MLNEVVMKSPAKLNLHLGVHPKRVDGYHDIESIFQAIDFFDDLFVTKKGDDCSCTVEVTSMKLPIENTLTVAYKEFCAYTGVKKGVHVKLVKRIFSGAGLGGGSSNGATLIKALDVLFETKLSLGEKVKLAEKVGSDVPFFMYCGAAVVTGRGEIIRQIIPRNDLYFVIVMPDVHSSTKEAFQALDEYYEKNETSKFLSSHEVEDVYRMSAENWSFTNSFTDVLVKRYPQIGKALSCIKESGSVFTQMSGSGACVFGVFGNEEEAKRAYTQLSMEWTCRMARTYSISQM